MLSVNYPSSSLESSLENSGSLGALDFDSSDFNYDPSQESVHSPELKKILDNFTKKFNRKEDSFRKAVESIVSDIETYATEQINNQTYLCDFQLFLILSSNEIQENILEVCNLKGEKAKRAVEQAFSLKLWCFIENSIKPYPHQAYFELYNLLREILPAESLAPALNELEQKFWSRLMDKNEVVSYTDALYYLPCFARLEYQKYFKEKVAYQLLKQFKKDMSTAKFDMIKFKILISQLEELLRGLDISAEAKKVVASEQQEFSKKGASPRSLAVSAVVDATAARRLEMIRSEESLEVDSDFNFTVISEQNDQLLFKLMRHHFEMIATLENLNGVNWECGVEGLEQSYHGIASKLELEPLKLENDTSIDHDLAFYLQNEEVELYEISQRERVSGIKSLTPEPHPL